MAKTAWVVMSEFDSPVAICIPTPKAVFLNKRDAQKFCDDHNNNPRTSTQYYLRKAEYMGSNATLPGPAGVRAE